jgi:hypothetical protein
VVHGARPHITTDTSRRVMDPIMYVWQLSI